MTTADILRRARSLIEREECWTKGDYRKQVGAHFARCAAGAIIDAATPCHGAMLCLMDAMPPGHHVVPDYNDLPTTTHADVLALFSRAIAAAEAEERR